MKRMLDLRIDLVFKMFFTREANRELLIDFLTAFIRPASPIENVEILNPILENDVISNKVSILDLRLQLHTGELIDVEMQMLKQKFFRKRIVYYWSKLHHGQLSIGENYDLLKKTISIAILDFEEFKNSKDSHHVFEIRNRKNCELLSDDLIIHFLELPKLEYNQEMGHIEKWGRFFYGISSDEDVIMAKAQRALMELSEDEKAFHLAMDREKAIRDHRSFEAEKLETQLEIADNKQKIAALNAVVSEEKQKIEALNAVVSEEKQKIEALNAKVTKEKQKLEIINDEISDGYENLESLKVAIVEGSENLECIKVAVKEENEKLLQTKKQVYHLFKQLEKSDSDISILMNLTLEELNQLK